MDITPSIPTDKKVIKAYGDGLFRVNDDEYKSGIMVLPDKVKKLEISAIDGINADFLDSILQGENIEILLIGCGAVHMAVPQEIRLYSANKGIGLEVMTTGAACRTYNVLLSEGRGVAALLVLV